uniref:Uncharacterized protein n=1 Tax=Rhizophora mucronata TaxID=61149 RepID=A0A2P2PVI1_RHIMU
METCNLAEILSTDNQQLCLR